MALRSDNHSRIVTEAALEDKIMALRRTLSWMDHVMAGVNEGIIVIDDDWRIVFANNYLAELLDRNRISLLGKKVWDVLPIPKPESDMAITDADRLTGVYEISLSRVTFKVLFQPKYVKHLNQLVCIMSDVSMEMNAGSALRSLQEQVKQLKAELEQASKPAG